MGSKGERPVLRAERDTVRYTVLSPKAIWAAAAVIVLVGIGVAVWLLFAYGKGDAQQRNQLEAIKTAGTIIVGTGGAAALLLAARRQRSAEIALKQKELDQEAVARTHVLQERVADDAKQDATERRVTESYTKAVEQLGSDKPPVQLGGLYALERLGQGNTDQRQTIVNVVCAYLRMFTGLTDDLAADRTREQERRVRRAAQAILAAHLRPDTADGKYWPDTDIDLSGASLLDFDLRDCRVRSATFATTTFTGEARFAGMTCVGDASFASATFGGASDFSRASFGAAAVFDSTVFTGAALFESARFAEGPRFEYAVFAAQCRFASSVFDTGKEPEGVPFEQLPVAARTKMRSLPLELPYRDLVEAGTERIPVGLDAEEHQPVSLDFSADSHFMAFLGAGSGKTNLLRAVVRGITDRHTPKEAAIILVDFKRTMLELSDTPHLLSYVVSSEQLVAVMADVESSLRKRLPGKDVSLEQLRDRSWWTGPEVYVVIDDYQILRHRGTNPLDPLREFLPLAKDVGLHLVVARDTKGAGGTNGDQVLDALRSLGTPGLVGNGDPAEGSLVGDVAPAGLLPGRATRSGRGGEGLLQIAWLAPEG
ncbi:FtsK/SpoIIIE domain-containing protein [Amycolatopsis sp. lyj-112]|uniref:FtsK/SpoIIIE domain-containing protein n=1 Tax=Amycolatopsis sp. lyj-112 TaxID=2789288 RepID=UPI00397CE96E